MPPPSYQMTGHGSNLPPAVDPVQLDRPTSHGLKAIASSASTGCPAPFAPTTGCRLPPPASTDSRTSRRQLEAGVIPPAHAVVTVPRQMAPVHSFPVLSLDELVQLSFRPPAHRLPQPHKGGQATQILKRGVAIIVGGWAVTAFNVDGVPNPHVIGRHVIVPETGRHVQQVRGVAAQLVDHVFKRLEAGFIGLRLLGRVDGMKRRAEFFDVAVDLTVRGVRQDDEWKFLRDCGQSGRDVRVRAPGGNGLVQLLGFRFVIGHAPALCSSGATPP